MTAERLHCYLFS